MKTSRPSFHLVSQLLLIVGIAANPVRAADQNVTGNLTVSGTSMLTGNVGIGTSTPGSKLTVAGGRLQVSGSTVPSSGAGIELGYDGTTGVLTTYDRGTSAYKALRYNSLVHQFENSATEAMRITGGNVGIGTTNPLAPLQVGDGTDATNMTGVAGFIRATSHSYSAGFTARRDGYAEVGMRAGPWGELGTFTNHNLLVIINATERMRIDTAGNVGIGTTDPGSYKLAVNGTIHAKGVVVNQTGWSDYVFKPGYQLPSLSDVEAHIRTHGTLPGVPSEAEVAKEGVNLGDMQARLLAKVEELTLHQIEQEKQLAAQAARIAALEQENARLRQQP